MRTGTLQCMRRGPATHCNRLAIFTLDEAIDKFCAVDWFSRDKFGVHVGRRGPSPYDSPYHTFHECAVFSSHLARKVGRVRSGRAWPDSRLPEYQKAAQPWPKRPQAAALPRVRWGRNNVFWTLKHKKVEFPYLAAYASQAPRDNIGTLVNIAQVR